MENTHSRLNRYSRFLDTDDARKTLDEIDSMFGLDKSVFPILGKQTNNATETIIAREGARAYSQALRTLVSQTKQQMEIENEQRTTDT